jgi:hypothetical protein
MHIISNVVNCNFIIFVEIIPCSENRLLNCYYIRHDDKEICEFFAISIDPMAAFIRPYTRSLARCWPLNKSQWTQICRRSLKKSPSCSNVTVSS